MRDIVKIFVVGLLLAATTSLPAGFPPYVPQNPIRDVTGKKTGFFHVEKQADGRWWVIDPAGYGFVPIGVDQCRLEHHPGYKELMLAKHGTVEGWEAETVARLKDWGFTLFGGACSHRLFHKGIAHTIYPWVGEPYSFDGGEKAILKGTGHPGTAFPNVFDPGFEEYCRRCTKRVFAPQKNDPWLFGWFFDNELAWWGNQHEMVDCYGLVDAIAALPPEHSARKAHDDFFAAHRGEWPAAKIRREFMRLVAERYFGIITSAIREADPNHMILGCRFAGVGDASVAPEVWEAAGLHLDIVSFNNYPWADLERRRVLVSESATQTVIDRYEEIYRLTGRPLMVTEWSFPALDRGMPCTWGAGMRVKTQAERVQACELVAKTFLSCPQVVGYDYFMWRDQLAVAVSSTSKENCNYGLVDADGNPYADLTAMFRRLHAEVGFWRRAETPSENAVPDSCMPQSAAEYVRRRRAQGGKPGFSCSTGAGPIARIEGIGSLNVCIDCKVGEKRGYPLARQVEDVRSEAGPEGLSSTVVVSTGCFCETTFECEVRLTPLHDGSFLAEFRRVKNRGPSSITFGTCFFFPATAFPAESAYPLRQAPMVWNEPRRLAWREKGGVRELGCETWSAAWSPRSAFWLGKQGDVHPDAMFQCRHPVTLGAGEEWTPPQDGLFFIRVWWRGAGGGRRTRATRANGAPLPHGEPPSWRRTVTSR